MKKVLALVLALTMILTAVAAVAEGSKAVEDTKTATVTETNNENTGNAGNVGNAGDVVEEKEEIALIPLEEDEYGELEEEVQKVMEELVNAATSTEEDVDVLSVVPDQKNKIIEILKKNKNVTTVLPKDVKILEMVPFKLTGDLTELESDLEASINFESAISNNPGDIVAFMITAVVNKELVEFILEGTVNEKGGVDVIIPKDIAKQLQGKDFLITVLGL